MEIRQHSLDKVIGDLRGKVSTRRQLANFSDHQAHISMVEPKKVCEALEDPDWLEAIVAPRPKPLAGVLGMDRRQLNTSIVP